jgi:uncharacterized protein
VGDDAGVSIGTTHAYLTSAVLASTPAVTSAAVLAGIAGGTVLWRTSAGGAATGRALALGMATTAGAGLVALVVMVPGGLRVFGAAHLLYLLATVAVPMLGVALAGRLVAGDGLPRLAAAAAVVLLLPAAVGWYATHVAPFRLRVDEATVRIDPDRAGDDGVRIGVLSDLQTADVGEHEHRAVDRLLAGRPDLILLPGDLFQGTPAAFARHEDELRTLLGRLEAPHGVYFVRGDVDHGDFADRALAGTGVVILDDEVVDVEVGDRTVRLGGNRLSYRHDASVAVRRELAAEAPDGEDDGTIRVLMAHRPDAVLDLPPDSRVDLTVAGHTHGGQIALPGVGPLVTLSDVPRAVAAGGLHDIAGNAIYVSSGVGMERAQAPQVRFLSPPSVGLIDLR